MVGLHLVAQAIDDLLQRLHAGGLLDIVGHKRLDGDLQDLPQSGLHNIQLMEGGGGELHLLVVDLLGCLGDVQRVVGNTLKVRNSVQELADLLALGVGEGTAGDLHEIGTQLVLVAVNEGLCFHHVLERLLRIAGTQRHGVQQVAGGALCHGVGDKAALLDGEGGVLEEALLQTVHILLLGDEAGVGEQEHHQLLHGADQGEQHHQRGQTEQGVHQRDADGGHGVGQERKVQRSIEAVEHRCPDHHAQHIDEQVHEGGTLTVEVCAQRRQQHRHRRTDGDTHDDGERDLKGDGAGDGQRLQNTHCGRGALQHAGEGDTYQNAQQRVGERCEDADERLALPQGGDGAGHGGHSVHQHSEAQQDTSYMAGGGPAGAHTQDDADDRHDTGDHLGAQQLHKAAAAGDIGKAQDPAGDAGTKNGAHDDTDGLPHLHHTGVDEAHHHNRGGGGRLDHSGHAGSQQNALQWGAAQAVEDQLQLTAGNFLQAVSHQRYAKQE